MHPTTHSERFNLTSANDKNTSINEITGQLHCIIPQLSYELFNFHVAENQDSQADAAVLAFWETNDTTTITTNVNSSLEQEKHFNKETISSLITKTCKHELSKSYHHHNTNNKTHRSSHHPKVRFQTSSSFKHKNDLPSPQRNNAHPQPSNYHTSSQPSTYHTSDRTNLISQPRPTKKLKWTPPQHHTPQQTLSTTRHDTFKKIKQHNKRMQRISSKLVAKNYQNYQHNNHT